MRVLVTGASGFIGSHCVEQLIEAGHDVHAVVPAGVAPNNPAATWHHADLLESTSVRQLLADVRPTHLLHLAWFVAPGEFWSSAENLRWLQAGIDLAEAFAGIGGERCVIAGTCAEYAPSAEPLVEGVTPLRPTTLYGASKASLHLSAEAFFAGRGVSFAWGHIFYLYGPGEHTDRLVPSLVRSLSNGERFVCQHPNDVRDFLHVADVAGAFVALLGSEVEGDVNIASGVPTTVGELVNAVGDLVGRPELVECRLAVSQESRIVGDDSRLRSEVAYTPRFDLRSGLADTVARWQQHESREAGRAAASAEGGAE